MTLLETSDKHGTPLCPMSHGFDVSPQAQLHALVNKLLDEFYGKFKAKNMIDDEGEFASAELGEIYHDITYDSRFSNRMRLYQTTSQPTSMYRYYVESFWYQCLVCGFVLPAYRENIT